MNQFECSPVLLIGFNRPDFMRDQIAAVRAAKPTRLYVAVDGPREGRHDEAEKCAAVREAVKLVDWPCEVKTLFREKNLGCKIAPAQAIDWLFKNEDHGIILEDDTRPTIDFFMFMSSMLELYRHDERIGSVAGFNLLGSQKDHLSSYHFSRIPMLSGGWATWRRVWKLYELDGHSYLPRIDEVLQNTPMTPYYRRMLKKEVFRSVANNDAWDFQFTLMMLANRLLGVVPRNQLLTNVGIDVSADMATHTGGYYYYKPRWAMLGPMDRPIVHPKAVSCDEWADRRHELMEGAILPRGLSWIGCRIPALSPICAIFGRIVELIFPFLFRI